MQEGFDLLLCSLLVLSCATDVHNQVISVYKLLMNGCITEVHSHVISVCFPVQEGVDLLLYKLLMRGCITEVHSHVISLCFQVQEGVDLLLYNLLVLGCITDIHGHVWRRSSSDLYLIEAMPLLEHTESQVIYFPWPLF